MMSLFHNATIRNVLPTSSLFSNATVVISMYCVGNFLHCDEEFVGGLAAGLMAGPLYGAHAP